MKWTGWLWLLAPICIGGGVWLIVLHKLKRFSIHGIPLQPRPHEWEEWVRTHPYPPSEQVMDTFKRDSHGRFTK